MEARLKFLKVVKYIMRVTSFYPAFKKKFVLHLFCLLVELAVIIGKNGRNIPASEADDYIGGKYIHSTKGPSSNIKKKRLRIVYRFNRQRSSSKTSNTFLFAFIYYY